MGDLDLKFYWAVFLRRLPYFLVIAAFLLAIAVTIAFILPPVYRSTASMLVEPQQIPDELAQTTVPVDPYEQAQIIEQRLMTRANLLALAERVGLYADEPDMTADAIVGDMRERIEFIGFTPDVTTMRDPPGAIIIGVAFEAPTAELANKGANELVSLVLQENVRLRTGRAGDTLRVLRGRGRAAGGRARAPVRGDRRLQDRQRRGAARQPGPPAAPSSSARRSGSSTLEREEAALQQPARHRGLGLRAHRPRRRHRHAQPRGGGAAGAARAS